MATRISQIYYCLAALLIGAGYLHSTSVVAAEPEYLNQGQHWSMHQRKDFYSRDQGSQIMPLKWMFALKQANGSPFMAASLDRYGYLANPDSEPAGLPVGFTASSGKDRMIGMTCSACHTR
ncbi:MAG: di-heme-cytochrome C peroxidase, partial [Gammaproteobacteria bacterium]